MLDATTRSATTKSATTKGEAALKMRSLAYAASGLMKAESFLSKNLQSSPVDCDDWCKYWMLLVGAWYSLHHAEPFLQTEKLRLVLKVAHECAVTHLAASTPMPVPAIAGPNPWFAGYFLVSAEHRLQTFLTVARSLRSRVLISPSVRSVPGAKH